MSNPALKQKFRPRHRSYHRRAPQVPPTWNSWVEGGEVRAKKKRPLSKKWRVHAVAVISAVLVGLYLYVTL